jgi:ribosomal protein S18 acetylase RimI-like enzyme
MTDKITIAPLNAADIEDVGPLWRALMDHVAALPDALVPVRPSEESWVLERAVMLKALAGDAFVLVARRVDEPVGYAFVVVAGPDPVWYTGDSRAELAHLVVAEGERGDGVGSALMDAVDAELDHRGIEDVEIGVDTGNEGAERLYESRGYRADFRIFYGSPGRKPWACLRREEDDRKAGRGRFAPPAADAPPTAGPPPAAGASPAADTE